VADEEGGDAGGGGGGDVRGGVDAFGGGGNELGAESAGGEADGCALVESAPEWGGKRGGDGEWWARM